MKGGIRHFHQNVCEGKLYSQSGDYQGGLNSCYHFEVIGEDPNQVKRMVEEIEHWVGAKDVSLESWSKRIIEFFQNLLIKKGEN